MFACSGATVHASSGLAAVAYAMVLGKRRTNDANVNQPHNVSFIYLGLTFLWFGWFAFNAGSGLAANARAANSFVATHLAACVGAVVWVVLDYIHTRKWSVVGLCTGVVAGLATITPGSGFVSPSSALLFGLLGSIACNYAIRYKHKYGFDDALDVFTVHYVGGIVGLLLTGIFAERYIISLGSPAGTLMSDVQIGGWLDGHWMQVPIQLAMIASVSGWSFVVTYLILIIINCFPYLRLRLADHDEHIGTDWAQMGERAYGYIQWEEAMLQRAQHEQLDQQSIAEANNRRKQFIRGLKKFLMIDNRHVVTGVPTLVEEPVLDYGQQKEQMATGGIHMGKLKNATGNNVVTAPLQRAKTSDTSIVQIENAGQSGSGTTSAADSSIERRDSSIEELPTDDSNGTAVQSSSSSTSDNAKQKNRA